MPLKPLDQNYDPGLLENEIVEYWQKNKTFEKSIENRSKANSFTFYDGPPFITGLPHYGHLLGSIVKDVIPRFQTMKGKRVPRVWGWDCHGLPAENKVEKELGINSKKEIEALGVDKFVAACKHYVNNVSAEWDWYVNRIGRWVDLKNAYRTMDEDYMESVLWVFKSLYDKDLIYKGNRVSLFCPRCSTPISNFEVAMDNTYKDVTDPSAYVAFKLKKDDVYLVAWTTTPWTLPSNMALAVNPTETYVRAKLSDKEIIVAKSRLKIFPEAKKLSTLKGKDLIGQEYEPLYRYFDTNKNDHHIYGADFVSLEEGTGIVHVAPGFGEDDTALGKEHGLTLSDSVTEEGKLISSVTVAADQFFKKADKSIITDLLDRGLLLKQETITHSYPHCHRCDTPLLYKSQVAWYIDIQSLKKDLLKTNENINWVPKYFKQGRFKQGIENAPDWCISRTRYWGAPLPVWECDSCDWRFVAGSIKEIEQASGQKVTDLHRPAIDNITLPCQKCQGTAHRVKEVLDSWLEAASMPYAERHFPFENETEFKHNFPGDFITEYTGQLRAWFYVMHVISNALYQSNSFKNVIVTGVIMGNDGRKMSKNYGNYPDPKDSLLKYGADALRLYLMGSPIVNGQDISISETDWQAQKNTLNVLWNSYKFFINYAVLDDWQPSINTSPKTSLDRWILIRLSQTTREIEKNLAKYQIPKAVAALSLFINDLSTWYIRRSRDRIGPGIEQSDDKNSTYQTLHQVFITILKTTSPLTPFIAEYLYRHLTAEESVHLLDWPKNEKVTQQDLELLTSMTLVREICSLGHAQRKEKNIPVRQPLAQVTITNALELKNQKDLLQLIKEELNVEAVKLKSGKSLQVTLDTAITEELKLKGELRGLIRQIQEKRKQANTDMDELVDVTLPSWPKQYEAEIKQKTLIRNLIQGDELKIHRLK